MATTEGESQADRLKRTDVWAATLALLGNPTRLQIVLELADGERGRAELIETLGMSETGFDVAISLLQRGGLIEARRGSRAFYTLTKAGERLANIVQGIGG